jgi:hypothetical protein
MIVEWDFNKLPENEHSKAIRLYEAGQWSKLMVIHNLYELSETVYCCSNQYDAIRLWFKKGIEEGLIRDKEKMIFRLTKALNVNGGAESYEGLRSNVKELYLLWKYEDIVRPLIYRDKKTNQDLSCRALANRYGVSKSFVNSIFQKVVQE